MFLPKLTSDSFKSLSLKLFENLENDNHYQRNFNYMKNKYRVSVSKKTNNNIDNL